MSTYQVDVNFELFSVYNNGDIGYDSDGFNIYDDLTLFDGEQERPRINEQQSSSKKQKDSLTNLSKSFEQ